MSAHKSDSKRDNNGGNGNGHDQKHDRNEENHVDAPAVKTITTICYDVLERIFDLLDVESLLNVADTCKRLQIAVKAKFGEMIEARDMPKSCSIYSGTMYRAAGINTSKGYIQVTGLKFCLQFLRCFGEKVTRMDIEYEDNVKHSEHINRYINRYCCDSLAHVTMDFKKTMLQNVPQPKPFKNVTYLSMSNFIAGKNQLAHAVGRFPNLRAFEIFYFDNEAAIDVTGGVAFPQIEHLTLCFYNSGWDSDELAAILSSNRHLKSLHLMDIVLLQLSDLLDMIEGYQSIVEIKIMNDDNLDNGNDVELTRFANEHPTIENLNLKWYVFKADDAIKFIRQSSNALKKFAFRVEGQSERDRVLNQLGNNEWQHNVSEEDAGGYFTIKSSR